MSRIIILPSLLIRTPDWFDLEFERDQRKLVFFCLNFGFGIDFVDDGFLVPSQPLLRYSGENWNLGFSSYLSAY